MWKPQLSDRVLHNAWLKSLRVRYADICCSARRAWEKDGNWKNKIGEDVWLSWIQYWNSPLFQSKSEIQKINRNSGVDVRPSTHTGGSLSHKKHVIHLVNISYIVLVTTTSILCCTLSQICTFHILYMYINFLCRLKSWRGNRLGWAVHMYMIEAININQLFELSKQVNVSTINLNQLFKLSCTYVHDRNNYFLL